MGQVETPTSHNIVPAIVETHADSLWPGQRLRELMKREEKQWSEVTPSCISPIQECLTSKWWTSHSNLIRSERHCLNNTLHCWWNCQSLYESHLDSLALMVASTYSSSSWLLKWYNKLVSIPVTRHSHKLSSGLVLEVFQFLDNNLAAPSYQRSCLLIWQLLLLSHICRWWLIIHDLIYIS